MFRLSTPRFRAMFLLLSALVSLSLLPFSLATDYCYCGNYEYKCTCGTCTCDNYNQGYCYGSCGGVGGGGIAGIVIACIVGVAIMLCICAMCYRRRNGLGGYAGNTYAAGGPVTTAAGVPMAVPAGGYGAASPMQAIPVQYGQYPTSPQQQQQYGAAPAQQYGGGSQPAYNPYGGTAYTQAPVGGGQPINGGGGYPANTAAPPPAYTASAPAAGQGYAEPYKPTQYEGERAL